MELRIVAFQTVLPNSAPLQHGAVAPQVPTLRAFRQRSETRPLLWRLERWLRRRQLVQAEQAVDGVFSMPASLRLDAAVLALEELDPPSRADRVRWPDGNGGTQVADPLREALR